MAASRNADAFRRIAMIRAANVVHMIKQYVGMEKDGREVVIGDEAQALGCAEIGCYGARSRGSS